MVPTHRIALGHYAQWSATANGCTVQWIVPAEQNLTAHGFITDTTAGVELLDDDGNRVAFVVRAL